MLWIGSFPRSGVTFFRIVLHEIYGLESSTYHTETAYPIDAGYDRYPAVKTHLLPYQLKPEDPSIPAIYLVRDGRDSLVSMAHQRSDIVAPGSSYYENLREAIVAANGSYFGGWSRHVRLWRERASLILRFEELVADPIACIEKIRAVYPLPEPRMERLPSFEDLKSKDFRYGSGVDHGFSTEARKEFRQKFFRRGKTGAWRDEMPEDLHRLFLELHGEVLEELGYYKESDLTPQDLPELALAQKYAEITQCVPSCSFSSRFSCIPRNEHRVPAWIADRSVSTKGRILIEGWRLLSPRMDGSKRYLLELLKGLRKYCEDPEETDGDICEFEVYVHMGDNLVVRLFDQALTPYLSARPDTASAPPFPVPEEACAPTVPESSSLWSSFLKEARFRLWHFMWLRRWQQERDRRSGPYHFDLLHLTSTGSYHLLMEHAQHVLATIHDMSHRQRFRFAPTSAMIRNRGALDALMACSARFLTSSRAVHNDLLASRGGLEPERVFFVPEWCDPENVRRIVDEAKIERVRSRYSISAGRYLLCVGSLDPRKNLANALAAFDSLAAKCRPGDLTLVVAGLSKEDVQGRIDQQLVSSERIVFAGFVEDEDLPALYSGAIALCCPSYYDCTGFSAIEAMACGTPVIYGRSSGLQSLVLQGGIAVDPDDIADIREKMSLLAMNQEVRSSLAWSGVKRIGCFSFDKMIQSTMDIYRSILLKRPVEQS